MKKGLIAMFGLMAITCLAACDNNASDQPDVENPDTQVVDANITNNQWEENQWNELNPEESRADLYAKTSLTNEDFDEIDASLFPISYTYETYNWETWEMTDSGEYTYPEDIDHSLLLPIHATMIERSIESSSIEDDMIYSSTTATLQDGTIVSILYINNPATLQYVAASVNNGSETSLYTFSY